MEHDNRQPKNIKFEGRGPSKARTAIAMASSIELFFVQAKASAYRPVFGHKDQKQANRVVKSKRQLELFHVEHNNKRPKNIVFVGSVQQ